MVEGDMAITWKQFSVVTEDMVHYDDFIMHVHLEDSQCVCVYFAKFALRFLGFVTPLKN